MSRLTEKLRCRDRRITGPRQAVLDVLRVQRHPLTIKEIHGLLPVVKCDLATIYRSIRLLQDLKLVQRFDFGDGVARFEMLASDDHGHHHHLICTECSRIVEIEECFPPDLQSKIARDNGFQRVTHKLEFFGICPDCQ